MGNLGRYQEIVELAKQSGGVDPMLDTIKKGAVAVAAPKLIGVGFAAGAAVAVGISKGYDRMKQTIASRRQAMKDGDATEQDLRQAIDIQHHSEQSAEVALPDWEEGTSPSAADQPSERGNGHADWS